MADATSGVVVTAKKLKIRNANENTAVFTPNAANSAAPSFPTYTVSTMLKNGSAASVSSAGPARRKICSSYFDLHFHSHHLLSSLLGTSPRSPFGVNFVVALNRMGGRNSRGLSINDMTVFVRSKSKEN